MFSESTVAQIRSSVFVVQVRKTKSMPTIREKIVQIAREEASPLPFGKVSDLVVDADGNRAGWKRLQQYFDEAVEGWNSSKWTERGEIRIGGEGIKLSNLQGIQRPGLRVIQGKSKPSGVSWCGIFASWVYRQAGLDQVKWVNGQGISHNGVKLVNEKTGFQAGDTIVIRGGEVHHAIVAEMPSCYDQDDNGNLDTSIVTINGNSTNQSIRIHSEYKLSDVAYFYKVPELGGS